MTAFLDTSVLVKLFYPEADSEVYIKILARVPAIAISELSLIEFSSAIWKKVRSGRLHSEDAKQVIFRFRSWQTNCLVISLNEAMVNRAHNMLEKYGSSGLRTLDALQLAAALSVVSETVIALSSDQLLNSFFQHEGLTTLL
jgi:predicted nucleic acid-binding protein